MVLSTFVVLMLMCLVLVLTAIRLPIDSLSNPRQRNPQKFTKISTGLSTARKMPINFAADSPREF